MRVFLAFALVAVVAAGSAIPSSVAAAAAAYARLRRTHVGVGAADAEAVATALSFEAPSAAHAQAAAKRFLQHETESYLSAAATAGHEMTTAPEQIHLGVTGGSGSNVSVIWLTSPESVHAQVCWREAPRIAATGADADAPHPWAFAHCAAGATWTYNPISVLPWKGNIHGAHMTALIPGRRYEYSVGDPALNTTSPVFTFAAPQLQVDRAFVALGGDMGSIQLCGYKMAAQMLEYHTKVRRFDALWLLGDIAYSTLDPPRWNFEFFWDMYLRQEAPLLQHVPFLATYGNHDAAGGDSGAFIHRFRNPRAYGGHGNFYWAYRHGPVLFVSFCTEPGLVPAVCQYHPGSAQYQWLERTLAAVNRTETPWVIVAGHRPMYSSDKSTDSGPLQQYLEPLFLKHQVDVELAGHMHETELTAPVANGTAALDGVTKVGDGEYAFASPKAPVHLTMGNLGAVISETFVTPRPQWSLYRNGTLWDDAYGFATLDATTTSLQFTMLRQATNATMWSVRITK